MKIFHSKKSELGTRAAVFVCFGHLGSMAGGWIQAGLLKSLAGRNGLPAWRWIFIIVSVITIPTAMFGSFSNPRCVLALQTNSFLGWIFIPDLPSHRNAWYLNEEERNHAATRLGEPTKYTWDRTVFKRVLWSWQFWLLPTIFMCKRKHCIRNFVDTNSNIKKSVFSGNSDGTQQRLPLMDGFSWIYPSPTEQFSYRAICSCNRSNGVLLCSFR